MNNQRLARKIDSNQSTINDLMDELVEEIEMLEKENEILKQALHGIYNLCDNDNQTHEHIWRVADEVLH